MNEEISIEGSAGLSGTEYSRLITTDMSRKVDKLFGFNYISKYASNYAPKLSDESLTVEDIDEPAIFMYISDILSVSESPVRGLTGEINIPVSKEVDYNFRSARSFMIADYQSEKVIDYFFGLAKKVGFFFALPYDEIIQANNGISESHVQIAANDGYVRVGVTTRIDGNPLRIVEVTDKFCPLEKRL